MKIGIVCEGRSDFPAIVSFFGAALESEGIIASFEPLFPRFDQTRSSGGWANVLLWLERNPPDFRIQNYFAGGLFFGSLGRDPLDAIIIQLDSDVINDNSFTNFVKENYQIDATPPTEPEGRGKFVKTVLNRAAKISDLCESDARKHVLAPSVESIETWCIAAFHGQPSTWEFLSGQDLINSFMSALERSEGREPKSEYSNIDKDFERRKRFCKKHQGGHNRIIESCPHFLEAYQNLKNLYDLID